MEKDNPASRLKLSVAMAILRSKPEGMTGPQYAQQLMDKFRTGQLNWKQRCRDAEMEVLHLRQKLLMQKSSTGTVDQSEPDLQDSQRASASERLDSQPLFPSPPASGKVKEATEGATTTSVAATSSQASAAPTSLTQHTVFLQHVLNLQSGSKSIHADGYFQEVVKDSLMHSLYLLQKYLGGSEFSWNIQKQCVRCVVVLVDKAPPDLVNVLLDKALDLCMQIINTVVSAPDCNIQRTEVNRHLVDLLVEFSSSQLILPMLLTQLCECLCTFSDEIRTVQRIDGTFNSTKFCNMYYILNACERCLQCDNARNLDNGVKEKLQTILENSLLHLTEAYPLFAHGIWKLCRYL